MADIKQKALALVNEVSGEKFVCLSEAYAYEIREALCRAIEQHEAFRQEVSDAVEAVFAGYHDAPIPWVVMRRKLERFIIAKPDPLVEVLNDLEWRNAEQLAPDLRAALAARGLEIREKQP